MTPQQQAYADTKFMELRGQVDGLKSDIAAQFATASASINLELEKNSSELRVAIASKPGTGTLVGSLIASVAVLIGVLAFGGDRFDGGVQVTSVSVMQAQEARELAAENARQIQSILEVLSKPPTPVEPQSPQDSPTKTQP